jgi:hypothetical protein
MGMALDKRQRDELARKDDHHRRRMLADARSVIYEGRYAVDGAKVKAILQKESLAAVSVGIRAHCLKRSLTIILPRVHSRRGCLISILIYFQCLLWT